MRTLAVSLWRSGDGSTSIASQLEFTSHNWPPEIWDICVLLIAIVLLKLEKVFNSAELAAAAAAGQQGSTKQVHKSKN